MAFFGQSLNPKNTSAKKKKKSASLREQKLLYSQDVGGKFGAAGMLEMARDSWIEHRTLAMSIPS